MERVAAGSENGSSYHSKSLELNPCAFIFAFVILTANTELAADFFGAIAKSEQKLVDALMEAANLETKLLQAGKE